MRGLLWLEIVAWSSDFVTGFSVSCVGVGTLLSMRIICAIICNFSVTQNVVFANCLVRVGSLGFPLTVRATGGS